ncbi:MAG: acyl carrier protein [Planctomycetota bacterium]
MSDVAHSLREFIRKNFLYGQEAAFSDDDSFLEQGMIDSTGVLELVAHLEREYGMTVDDEDLVPDNLDSIDNLVRFIASKRECAPVES